MQLSRLTVLDFCWVGAGAFVTRILADLGADVIKVESRSHPDNLRLSGPHRPGAKPLESSGYFASRNTGKRSFALNMQHPKGRAIALQLAAKCSIVSNNFRPGVMKKWGLDYDAVSATNKSVIYLSMPMQGSEGPHRDFIGFGSTIAALCGLVNMAGLPGRPPLGTGTHYPDHVPNPGHALVALMAAIFHRARTGEGQQIELAQIESTINLLGPSLLAWSANGTKPKPNGNYQQGHGPRGVFPCRGDDVWCAIDVMSDEQWSALTDVLGKPGWMADSVLNTCVGREANCDLVDRGLRQETVRFDAADLAERLQRGGVPAAMVETNADVLSDPQLNARGYWQQVPHSEMGTLVVNVPPFISNGEKRVPPGPPPLLGEHTRQIAAELLAIGENEYQQLVDEKVFY
jgi:benzylsuccinate CoA-transferase BbsF subunit